MIQRPEDLADLSDRELRVFTVVLVGVIYRHRSGAGGCIICAPEVTAMPCHVSNNAFNNLVTIRDIQNQRAKEPTP